MTGKMNAADNTNTNTDNENTATKTASNSTDYFISENKESYVTINGSAMKVGSPEFLKHLQSQYFVQKHSAMSKSQLNKAVATIDMQVQLLGETHTVWHRVGRVDDTIYIDLCNDQHEVVKITADEVEIVTDYPVKFARPANMKAIGRPNLEAGPEDLKRLEEYISFKTDGNDDAENPDVSEYFITLVAWLLGSLNTDGGYPLMFVTGEQGSSKSTASEIIKDLLDASCTPLRNMSTKMQDIMIGASNEFIQSYDNISNM